METYDMGLKELAIRDLGYRYLQGQLDSLRVLPTTINDDVTEYQRYSYSLNSIIALQRPYLKGIVKSPLTLVGIIENMKLKDRLEDEMDKLLSKLNDDIEKHLKKIRGKSK